MQKAVIKSEEVTMHGGDFTGCHRQAKLVRHLVDASHHREHGTVRYERRLDAGLRQLHGHARSLVDRRALGDHNLRQRFTAESTRT